MKTLHNIMVGQHIKAHMKHQGVTVDKLSKVTGISSGSFFTFLGGRMSVSKKTMVAICKFLDLQNPLELYKTQYIKG
jgi:lambda repressor-like predicted transcriptional regulator